MAGVDCRKHNELTHEEQSSLNQLFPIFEKTFQLSNMFDFGLLRTLHTYKYEETESLPEVYFGDSMAG